MIESGGTIKQETRNFDSGRGETRSSRSKEDAQDYRYFPDPDLLPLIFTQEYVDQIRATLPELPDARKNRYIKDFGLSAYDAGVLIAEKETAEFFETVAKGRDAKQAANWVTGDFFAMLKRRGATFETSPISATNLGKLLDLQPTARSRAASPRTCSSPWKRPARTRLSLVEERGLKQVTDTGAIEAAIKAVIDANPGQVAAYKAKPTMFGWFVGQVMKSTAARPTRRS